MVAGAKDADKKTLYGDGYVLVEAARRVQALMRSKYLEQAVCQSAEEVERSLLAIGEIGYCMDTINTLCMELREAAKYVPGLNRLIEAENRLRARLGTHQQALRETGSGAVAELIQKRLRVITDTTNECIKLVETLRKEATEYQIAEQRKQAS